MLFANCQTVYLWSEFVRSTYGVDVTMRVGGSGKATRDQLQRDTVVASTRRVKSTLVGAANASKPPPCAFPYDNHSNWPLSTQPTELLHLPGDYQNYRVTPYESLLVVHP